MTAREAFWSVVRGGTAPARPVFLLSGEAPSSLARDLHSTERIGLAEVASPLSRAISRGEREALLLALTEDPVAGNASLDDLVAETAAEIDSKLSEGFDGILYRLEGPEPALTTPMQYGGFFLERDRELLAALPEGAICVLWIQAGPDAYLDFVSDLPAHLFAWDQRVTGVSLATVREMRAGALATNDAEADIIFAATAADLTSVEPMTHV